MIDGDQGAGVDRSAGPSDVVGAADNSIASNVPSPLELLDSDYLALAATIEAEIIPRLLRAHRPDPRPPMDNPIRTEMAQRAIVDFAGLLITDESDVIKTFVTSLLVQGTTLDELFLDLLSPSADYLGELWWTDACTFTDVTLGLFKLQALLRDFGHRSRGSGVRTGGDAILLAAAPGSQHIFGFLLVEDFFRRAGWTVNSLPVATADDIINAVRNDWFAVVGISMSSDAYAPSLPALIATIRRISRNRALVVLVGGAFFKHHPERVALVGADATAGDARDAVAQAKRLLSAVSRN